MYNNNKSLWQFQMVILKNVYLEKWLFWKMVILKNIKKKSYFLISLSRFYSYTKKENSQNLVLDR